MSHSDPVYALSNKAASSSPDASPINEILATYRVGDSPAAKDPRDSQLLGLRHRLVASMVNTPSSLDDFSTRLQELDELVAPSIFKEEHQEAIRDCVVAHWKRSLVPGLTEVCISSIKQKLGGLLSVAALIDVGFAFRHGIDRQVAWLDLMMDTIGPAVARCCATKEQTTAVLRLIQSEYDRVFDVATF